MKSGSNHDDDFHRLRAGDLELCFHNGNVRYIQSGDTEIIRMIYLAVRDRNWGTLSTEIHNLNIQQGTRQFSVTFKMLFGNPVVFEADCALKGHADNRLEYHFSGRVTSDFWRNRIGFCVLHPVDDCAGKPCKIIHTSGTEEMGRFPGIINPHQPFVDIQRIGWWPRPGFAELTFEGDIFEMEDQRNWSDASFKTYSTPLAKPFPVKMNTGDRVEQTITLRADLPSLDKKSENEEKDGLIHYSFHYDRMTGVPSIGSLYRTENGKPDSSAIHLLKKTGITHIRYDIDFSSGGWHEALLQFIGDVEDIGTAAELAFHVNGNDHKNLIQAFKIFEKITEKVRCIEFFTIGSKTTRLNTLKDLLPVVRDTFPGVKIGAGTDFDFAEINRYRFNPDPVDFVLYSICPQVHAFDDLSLVENLEAQPDTVKSARSAFPGNGIHVSVISLLRRSNPDATKEDKPAGRVVPFDKRQMSVLGAQWGLVSLKHLMETKVDWITIFETHGYNGLILKDDRMEYGGLYPSDKWIQSPFSMMLEIILKFRPDTIVPSISSAPLKSEVILLKRKDQHLMVLINFTSQDQGIRKPVFPDPSTAILLTDEILQNHSPDDASILTFKPSEGKWQKDSLIIPSKSVLFLMY